MLAYLDRFAAEVRDARKTAARRVRVQSWRNVLTTPVVYSLAIPLLLLDVWVTAYQWLCFPIYGIEPVKHRSHFVIDRHRLSYLNAFEKANCFYCSYATGLFGYVREVAARTEQYWCPIKHSRPLRFPHSRYRTFAAYGDARGYQQGLPGLRRALNPGARRARPRRPSAT